MEIYVEFDFDEEWTTDKSLKESVLSNILIYIKNIFKQGISDYELNELLQLIYTINHLAMKQESILLHSGLINSISDLIYFSMLHYDKSINSLRVSILHLNELTFSSGLSNKMEQQSENEFSTSLTKFYTNILSNGLITAVVSLKTIIDYYHKMPSVEAKKFLIENAQFLINFLNPMQHWRYKNIDSLYENDEFKKIESAKINQLAKNIVFLAIYLYKYITEENINIKIVNDVALPLADNCHNLGKYYMMESKTFLSDYYFDYRFNTPIDSIASNWFDTNPVHEAGGYTPGFYDYSSFWFSLSIYRRIRGKSFIPHRPPTSEETWGKGELERYIERLKKDEIELISNLNEEEIIRLKKEYLDHLNLIFSKNN